MLLIKGLYEKIHHCEAPYYYNYSVITIIGKPLRKWIVNVIVPNCPFNVVRIFLYKLCGFKIGKGCFIGMKCYLDDMCYDKIIIGNDVTISYGVYFACHGINQKHQTIFLDDHSYIGMRSSIISKKVSSSSEEKEAGVHIGKHAIVGACTLVNRDVPDFATAVGCPCKIIMRENRT